MKRPLLLSLLPLLLAGPPSAAAETLRDTASGLSITAPAGTVATPSPPVAPGPIRPVFDIKRPGETDTGCRVSTVEATVNAFLSQAELNMRAASPEFQQAMIVELSAVYELVDMDVFPVGGITALGVVGDIRRPQGDTSPPVRSLLVFLDTPLQRVMLSCVADRGAFESRLPEFEAILSAIALN